MQFWEQNFFYLFEVLGEKWPSNLSQFTTKRWDKLYDLSFSLYWGLYRGQRWPLLYGRLEETSIVPPIVLKLTSSSKYDLHAQVCIAAWTSLVFKVPCPPKNKPTENARKPVNKVWIYVLFFGGIFGKHGSGYITFYYYMPSKPNFLGQILDVFTVLKTWSQL